MTQHPDYCRHGHDRVEHGTFGPRGWDCTECARVAAARRRERGWVHTDPRLAARIAENTEVDESTGCIVWTGYTNADGYGESSLSGAKVKLHRAAWSLANDAPVPDGMAVLHSCDNPPCVNPAHLSIGSWRDNNREMVERRRAARGEAHPAHKLTEPEVLAIRAALKRGSRMSDLAVEYGVHPGTIRQIREGQTWKTLLATTR